MRHTATWDVHEIEVSGRFYDKEFENPFARPIAAADQSGGLRASNEAGGRVRYNAYLAKRVSLRTLFDMWSDVREVKPQLRTYFRMDVDATRWFTPGFWFDVQDRDLRTREFGECYFDYGSSATDTGSGSSAAMRRKLPCGRPALGQGGG